MLLGLSVYGLVPFEQKLAVNSFLGSGASETRYAPFNRVRIRGNYGDPAPECIMADGA